jgi:hypothetical protein
MQLQNKGSLLVHLLWAALPRFCFLLALQLWHLATLQALPPCSQAAQALLPKNQHSTSRLEQD